MSTPTGGHKKIRTIVISRISLDYIPDIISRSKILLNLPRHVPGLSRSREIKLQVGAQAGESISLQGFEMLGVHTTSSAN